MKVKLDFFFSKSTIAWLKAEADRRNSDPRYSSHDWTWQEVASVQAASKLHEWIDSERMKQESQSAQQQTQPQEAVA